MNKDIDSIGISTDATKKNYVSITEAAQCIETEGKPNLMVVLEIRKMLHQAKAKEIVFSSPIIFQFDKELIFPNTINGKLKLISEIF